MANNLATHSWFIDTASATPIWKDQVRVKMVEVVGADAGTIGNTMAEITDQNGHSILTAKYQTNAVGEIQTYNPENWFNGIIVLTLGTGVTLRLHVR
jgi:hypothetical protein